jgi:hypothetical protein
VQNAVPVVDTWSQEIAAVVEEGFTDPYTCGHFIAEHRERIAGRVIAGGQGACGIRVTLSGQHFSRSFVTGSGGEYFFYAPAGSYSLLFAQDGHIFSQQAVDVEVATGEVQVADVEVLLGVTFRAEPEAIPRGETAVLRWDALRAAEVTIDQGIGVVASSGSLPVTPAETTTYTITAHDGQGRTVSGQVTIVVHRPPQVNFNADCTDIAPGRPVVLSWSCTDADTVILEPFGWDMSDSGSYTVYPDVTTTYSIVAAGPGGTTTASVTVSVHRPPAVSIRAEPHTIYAGQPTTLTWTSSDADEVSLDNGIGPVALNGSLQVLPALSTTYTVTATGPGGTATAAVTVAVNSVISLHIDFPAPGSIIHGPDVLVTGTVSHAYGYETGVSVNGFTAMVYGNRFVANHVPLDLEENEMLVSAVDGQGNAADVSITVTSDSLEPVLKLTPRDMVGLAPFRTTISIRSVIASEHISLQDTGPAPLLYEQGEDASEWIIQADEPGVYTIEARENQTGIYSHRVAIVVFDREELDDLLREKWESLQSCLRNNDVEGALGDIAPSRVDDYRRIFNTMTPEKRASMADEMQDIQLIDMAGGSVEYDIRTVRNGRQCSFLLRFEMDADGFWRIDFF